MPLNNLKGKERFEGKEPTVGGALMKRTKVGDVSFDREPALSMAAGMSPL